MGRRAAPYKPASLPNRARVMMVLWPGPAYHVRGSALFAGRRIGRRGGSVHDGAPPQLLEDRRRKSLPRARHSPADHVNRQVQGIHQRRKHNSQTTADVAENAARIFIALDREIVNRFRAELRIGVGGTRQRRRAVVRNRFPRHPDHRRRRSVLLQASSIPAPARVPVRFNGRVPELPGHTVRAAPDRAAHDQSAAHAGTEGQHCHVGIILGRAQPFFSERGDIGVIFEDHNRLQALAQLRRERDSRPSPAGWAIRAIGQSAYR